MGVTVLQSLVMGDHDQGGFGCFTFEDVHDHVCIPVVQRGGGFVGKHNLGVVEQGPSDGGALLLADTQHVGFGVLPVGDVKAVQHRIHPLEHIVGDLAVGELVRKRKVLLHGQTLDKMWPLEHDAQFLAPPRVQLAIGRCIEGAIGHADGACIGPKQAAEQVQQGGFPCSGIAEQQKAIPLTAFEVREMHWLSVVAVLELHTLNADHGPKVH